MQFLLGVLFTIIGAFILVMLTFAYRDFSFELLTMFLIALFVYPYGIYLMTKRRKEENHD